MSSEVHISEPAWYRVRVSLLNIRKISGRIEHPCHIFHGLLLRVLRENSRMPPPVWCWHSAGEKPWADAIQKDYLYEIEVIFAASEPAHHFMDKLQRAKIENFRVGALDPPEIRSVSKLESESSAPVWTNDEICLDFLTPLGWEAKPGPTRWKLDGFRFVRMLHHRLAHILGITEPSQEAASPSVEIRPAFMDLIGGHPHRSKSSPGTELAFAGLRGPLYVRGDWPALWTQILACSELQLGSNTTRGQGHFKVRCDREFFDLRLKSPRTWQSALQVFRRREELKNKEPDGDLPSETDLPALSQAACSCCLELSAARSCEIPKKETAPPDSNPAVRQIAILPIREQFIHFVLHRLLQPTLEKIFFAESLGARLGRSREDARPLIQEALAAGCTHIVEADIEDFFNYIDWSVLARQIRHHLPKSDLATLALVEKCVRQPLADFHGHPLVRRCGILPGSPVSSLLANLYLHEWDMGMRARGWRFVRAVDDIRILTQSEKEAKAALADATTLLGPLGLRFKPAKLAVHDLRATHGFRFLGLDFGLDEAPAKESGAGLRRTLYLTRPETWAGLDGGALVLREGDRLDQRVPLHRVSEVVLLGAGGISTDLVDRCLDQGIPVSFCTKAGQHHGTLHPGARTVFARIARHHRRHELLGLPGRAAIAARLVQAKLANYLSWVEEHPAAETTSLRRLLRQRRDDAMATASRSDAAAAVDAIRGYEGAAARSLFPWINSRVRESDWVSSRRLAHERPDRWNLLLDTLSFLLFNRIHTACRTRGLDPWLGFLHSPDNRYPSLIYDLMEPFRARLDRFAVWLVNVGAIVPAFAELDGQGRWGFTRDGWKALLLQFEKQLNMAYAADEGRTWRQLLDRQIEDLVRWADEGGELRLYARPVLPWRKPGGQLRH